jgi:hypothetical protein
LNASHDLYSHKKGPKAPTVIVLRFVFNSGSGKVIIQDPVEMSKSLWTPPRIIRPDFQRKKSTLEALEAIEKEINRISLSKKQNLSAQHNTIKHIITYG